jgi:hypothetical protein
MFRKNIVFEKNFSMNGLDWLEWCWLVRNFICKSYFRVSFFRLKIFEIIIAEIWFDEMKFVKILTADLVKLVAEIFFS